MKKEHTEPDAEVWESYSEAEMPVVTSPWRCLFSGDAGMDGVMGIALGILFSVALWMLVIPLIWWGLR